MVADQVTIDTLSFKDGAESVHWSCDGGTEYDISEGTKTTPPIGAHVATKSV